MKLYKVNIPVKPEPPSRSWTLLGHQKVPLASPSVVSPHQGNNCSKLHKDGFAFVSFLICELDVSGIIFSGFFCSFSEGHSLTWLSLLVAVPSWSPLSPALLCEYSTSHSPIPFLMGIWMSSFWLLRLVWSTVFILSPFWRGDVRYSSWKNKDGLWEIIETNEHSTDSSAHPENGSQGWKARWEGGTKRESPEHRMIYGSACHPYLHLQGNSKPVRLVWPNSVAFQSTCRASKLTHLGALWWIRCYLANRPREGLVVIQSS